MHFRSSAKNKVSLFYLFVLQDEADGSNEYNNFQRESLNTTNNSSKTLENIDVVFHIGDYMLCKWLSFTVGPINSAG